MTHPQPESDGQGLEPRGRLILYLPGRARTCNRQIRNLELFQSSYGQRTGLNPNFSLLRDQELR